MCLRAGGRVCVGGGGGGGGGRVRRFRTPHGTRNVSVSVTWAGNEVQNL